jgi:outer membrane protein OmpA-like peptidoglycan-associated protein
VLTLRFVDNVLVDIPGPDLYVFELGVLEATRLSISRDGDSWIRIGVISGGRADVDISRFAFAHDVFHFVRLEDLKQNCEDPYRPGADIDAVGAIGSGLKISLKDSVLFNSGSATLKPQAKAQLDALALQVHQYPKAYLLIEGHTDNVGSVPYNQTPSEQRTAAVQQYWLDAKRLNEFTIETRGYGETSPMATNTTASGRAQNRRVDVIIIPAR